MISADFPFWLVQMSVPSWFWLYKPVDDFVSNLYSQHQPGTNVCTSQNGKFADV